MGAQEYSFLQRGFQRVCGATRCFVRDRDPRTAPQYKKVIKQKGNYDAMVGLVTSWDWSIRADGGIDCQTTIVAMGTNGLEKQIKRPR